MADTIMRGWKAQIYPTKAQNAKLRLWADHARGVWNRLLAAVIKQYETDGTFIWKDDLQKLVVAWKRDPDTAWMAELPAHAALDVCSRLDKALRRMLAERKSGRRWGFPRFKKKRLSEGSVYFISQRTRLSEDGRRCRLPKIGMVKLRGGSTPVGRLIGSRAVRDSKRWILAAQIECIRPTPLIATGTRLGIDSGLRSVTTFDGKTTETTQQPRPFKKALKRLRRVQRRLSARRKTSARRQSQARRVAELNRKVRCKRADFLHKLSHRLTTKADALVVEDLDVRGIARTPYLGQLAQDAAMGELLRQLAYKSDWRGRSLIRASRNFPSSKICCRCGARHEMPLRKRRMSCECGNRMDRDANAAINLYWYPGEPENRGGNAPTRGEIGWQGFAPVPVAEPRMQADK